MRSFFRNMRVKVILNLLVSSIILAVIIIATGIYIGGVYQMVYVLILALAGIGMYFVFSQLIRRWLIEPLENMRNQAIEIAADETRLGEQLPLPSVRELRGLTRAFNQLSTYLRLQRDAQEERITERTHELVRSQKLIQNVLNLTPSGLCLLDVQRNRFVLVNEPMAQFFGILAADFIQYGDEFILKHLHPDDIKLYQEMMEQLSDLDEGEMAETRYRLTNRTGSYRWILFRGIITEKQKEGKPRLILFVAEDITEAHYAEERLRYTSTHDMLTGLYNWAFFEESIVRTRQSEGRKYYPASIIMMDVDNLKVINDTIGHNAGDELLRRVGGILMSSFRDGDVVARVGGDEFAALLPGAGADALPHILRRINNRLREATLVAGLRLDVLSIGASTANTPEELDDARKQADLTMYQEKQRRKSGEPKPDESKPESAPGEPEQQF